MKKTAYVLLAALLLSCSVEASFDIPKNEKVGTMSLSVGISNEVETYIASRATSDAYIIAADLVPASTDLKLSIYERSANSEGENVYELYKDYTSVGEYDSPSMLAGDYMAVVESRGNDIDEEGEKNAFFAGSSDFTITPIDEATNVAIEATLANAIIELKVTDNFNNYFAGGATLTLSTEGGGELTLEFPTSEEKVLFVAPKTTLYLAGSAIKQTGTTTTFTKNKVGVAAKGAMNSVVVDASETGGATITVTINDTITIVSTTTVDVNSGDIATDIVE